MRRAFCSCGAAAAILFVQACGYIGPIVPPSLHIPIAVSNLTVIERGDQLEYRMTLPPQTTDGSTIDSFHDVDLRIGPEVSPMDFNSWALKSKPAAVSIERADAAARASQPLIGAFPVSDWQGKTVSIAVRTAQRKGRYSQWSNVVHLRLVDPLETPDFTLAASAAGVKVTIRSRNHGAKTRIFRQGPNDQRQVEAGVAEGNEFEDSGAEYGTKYAYAVTAFDDTDKANAESNESASKEITPVDTFAPTVPAALTALPSANSVELSWDRSPEADTKGYYVFRSVDGGPFARIGDMVALPTYSDKDVQRGKTYRYEISAIDIRNNESERSAPAETKY